MNSNNLIIITYLAGTGAKTYRYHSVRDRSKLHWINYSTLLVTTDKGSVRINNVVSAEEYDVGADSNIKELVSYVR